MIYLILDCYKDWNTGGEYHDIFKVGHTGNFKKRTEAYDCHNYGYSMDGFLGPDELEGYLHYWFRDLCLSSFGIEEYKWYREWFRFSQEAVDIFKYASNPTLDIIGKELRREEFIEVLRSYLLYLRNPLVRYVSGIPKLLNELGNEFKKYTSLEWEEDIYKRSFFCRCCEIFREALQVWKEFDFSEILKGVEKVSVSSELMDSLVEGFKEENTKIEEKSKESLKNKIKETEDLLLTFKEAPESRKATLSATYRDASHNYKKNFISFENDIPVFNTLVRMAEEYCFKP